jgi:hypothetical protein
MKKKVLIITLPVITIMGLLIFLPVGVLNAVAPVVVAVLVLVFLIWFREWTRRRRLTRYVVIKRR